MYPKLVGGLGEASTARAAAFYESVLDAEIVAMSSAEAAEMAKLAETTYRDVNIALANEFAGFAVDARPRHPRGHRSREQPALLAHPPARASASAGTASPCIRASCWRAPGSLPLVALARSINDGQVDVALDAIRRELGGLAGQPVLVLGLTYRTGVKELAYSQGPELVRRLGALGADVYAFDPLLSESEIRSLGASPWTWGAPLRAGPSSRRRTTRAGRRSISRGSPGCGCSSTAGTASRTSRCRGTSATSGWACRGGVGPDADE